MAGQLTCTRCGTANPIRDLAVGTIRCVCCGRKIEVPPVIASLPRPDAPLPAVSTGPPTTPDLPILAEPQTTEQVEVALASAMPWVISLFLHAGLMLVMVLAVMIVVVDKIPPVIPIPGPVLSDNPGGRINLGDFKSELDARQPRPTDQNLWSRDPGAISADTGKTDKRIKLIGQSVGGMTSGGLAAFGLTIGGRDGTIFGPHGDGGGNVHHVVYVIDKSGSMASEGLFDSVREQMLISVSKLSNTQDFHVILFSDGPPDEFAPRKLIPADETYKWELAKWLKGVRPHSTTGGTDPTAALVRAFEVLRAADPHRPGKMIHLLTDGVFLDNARVLEAIRQRNKGKEVNIRTYLYGFKPPEAVRVMKLIAEENGGPYLYVNPNE